MSWILFGICLSASCMGALVGAGGGVIMKPILDLMQIMSVPAVSFCSGCTVLAMAVFSLLASRKNEVKVEWRTSTPLAIGAAVGGLLGKALFGACQRWFASAGNLLGAIQNGFLLVLTVLVFVYMRKKEHIVSRRMEGKAAILAIGLSLGMVSSFLGIGGGPFNIAVLYYFFSMNAKQAALNSIYVIFFSQVASLLLTVATGRIPAFPPAYLLMMAAGGVCGAFLARRIGKRMSNAGVEKVLVGMLAIIVLLCAYNIAQFIA